MVKIKLDRKQRFLVNALLLGVLMYLLSFGFINVTAPILAAVLLYIFISMFIVHYPNLDIRTVSTSSILPVFLFTGAFLILRFFPNITDIFKLVLIFGFSVLYYIVSLVDNIFLVVKERKEIIPLYRVAVTWSHIMIIIIAIPFYTGIFKTSLNSLFQNLIIFLTTFIFCEYIIWASREDKGMKDVSVAEGLLLSAFSSLMIIGMSTAVSFFPTEAFMRALLVSATLMFVMNYSITGYLKNEINKKIIIEYAGILLIFLFLTLVFD